MARVKWLDALKGFAIIFVVLGHVVAGLIDSELYKASDKMLYFIYNVCYSFHMPLFFILSGLSFSLAYVDKADSSLKLNRVFRQLINVVLLYFLWSLLMCSFKIIFSANVVNHVGIIDFVKIPISAIAPYWYLYVLAFCYLLYILLARFNISSLALTLLSLAVSFSVYWIVNSFIGLYTVSYTLIYFGFFCLGIYLCKDNVKISTRVSFLILISGITLATFLSFLSTAKVAWSQIPVFGCIFALLISVGLIQIFKRFELQFFSLIGQFSLEIFVIHCFVTALMRKVFGCVDSCMFHVVVSTIVAIAVPIIISKLLKKFNIHHWLFKPVKLFSK